MIETDTWVLVCYFCKRFAAYLSYNIIIIYWQNNIYEGCSKSNGYYLIEIARYYLQIWSFVAWTFPTRRNFFSTSHTEVFRSKNIRYVVGESATLHESRYFKQLFLPGYVCVVLISAWRRFHTVWAPGICLICPIQAFQVSNRFFCRYGTYMILILAESPFCERRPKISSYVFKL
jgi:hypothetical protein